MTRARTSCQRGVVMLEMLLCLMPVMVMFLATIQASFLSVAHLVVQHAAQRGARTAIVVLEEDPKYFGDSPRGHLGESDDPPNASTLGTHFDQITRTLINREPTRINAIRSAVYLPLSLIGPGGMATGLLYNLASTAVTFPQVPKSNTLRTSDYGPTDEITVRVTYLFKCETPIASTLMCDKLYELELEQERTVSELEHVELPDAQVLLMLGGGRFTTIQAEVTLPIQGAHYYARQP